MSPKPKPDDTVAVINNRLVALAAAHPDGPHVHPVLVRFKDGPNKAAWSNFHAEVDLMTTVKSLTHTGRNRKLGMIALFNNLPVNWIRAQKAHGPVGHWRETEFHIWAAAIFKDAAGAKHLVLWDCDKHGGRPEWTLELAVSSKVRQKDICEHLQKALRDEVKASYLWVYLGSEFKGQGLCHQYSWQQLVRWAQMSDAEVVMPEGGWAELPSRDARFRDCVLIAYK